MTEHFDVAVHQVRAGSADAAPSNFQSEAPAARSLELDELTVLTGWAQALAEALAYAPACIEPLLADVTPGAPWRTALRVPEPSQQLRKAIGFLERAVRAVTPADGLPTLDALLNSCIENLPREEGLEKLVARVLRSTLEQLRTRPAIEAQVTTATNRAHQDGNNRQQPAWPSSTFVPTQAEAENVA